MTESFLSIESPTQGIFKDKGSKFIAFAQPVTDFEQIKGSLDDCKKKYFDAHHHCYAWAQGPNRERYKAFDDGEPNHSAGDPIYGQIRSRNLTNILIVVVRYFGGTKLGVSGLIEPYKAAAMDALSKAFIVEQFIYLPHTLEFDYEETSLAMALAKEFDLTILGQEFYPRCQLIVNVKIGMVERLISRVKMLGAKGHTMVIIA